MPSTSPRKKDCFQGITGKRCIFSRKLVSEFCSCTLVNSVQTWRIVKDEVQRSPLFEDFLEGGIFIRCVSSLGNPVHDPFKSKKNHLFLQTPLANLLVFTMPPLCTLLIYCYIKIRWAHSFKAQRGRSGLKLRGQTPI